uniref:Uncharacterized protein n=1 Tax=Ditylenchus dipsaci TaxID=166011 RepID=A0A915CRR6_9BILA
MSSYRKKRESSSNLTNGDLSLSKSFKSSRLSMGGRIGDVVAVMNHSEIDESSAVFCEHVNRADNKVFTIKNAGTSDVKHIGREESAGDGFEYVLAFVNKRTKQVEYRPVSVIQFEAKYKPPAELLTGEKVQTKPDYSQNFARDNYAADRKSLTAVFGSQKKNKALEAAAEEM